MTISLNHQSKSLLNLAKELSSYYKETKNVVSVIVGGSVSEGFADTLSDIEIIVVWDKIPLKSERIEPIQRFGGVIKNFLEFNLQEQNGLEDMEHKNVKFDVTHVTSQKITEIVFDVVERFDISLNKQKIVSTVKNCIVLYDKGLIRNLKDKSGDYPEEFKKRMINTYLSFNPKAGRLNKMKRKSYLLLYEDFCEVLKNILLVLLGINKTYYSGFKWLDHIIPNLTIKPKNFKHVLTEILTSGPRKGAFACNKVIEEVILLVEKNSPTVDITPAKERFFYKRNSI